jgi:metal-responsive CopG/Arc/MetJ family transcriptional regulator
MKVAVSIPDPLFEEADRLAERMRTTRSAIYANALNAYLQAHSPDSLTDSLNAALAGVEPSEEEFARTAARRTLRRSEW